MSIVNNMDVLVEWAEAKICSKVKLKLPSDAAADGGYGYELVSPAAFPLYVPTKDRLPPKAMAPIPSLCVQILEGKDMPGSGSAMYRFCLSAWNPGRHGGDMLAPKPGAPGAYMKPQGPEAAAYYERDSEGWRDAWGFADVALREIESAEVIGGLLRVMHEEGITYGPFTEQETIYDYYPYWFAWVAFSASYAMARRKPQYEHLL